MQMNGRGKCLVLLVLLTAVGCAHPSSDAGTTTTTSAPASTSTTALPSAVTVGESQNGHTIHLERGEQLQVVLSSTYWQFEPASNAAVLSPNGPPRIVPKRSGCVPGEGCGTASVQYSTLARGNAEVLASRTSCGEAMGCTAATDHYVLHVVVTE